MHVMNVMKTIPNKLMEKPVMPPLPVELTISADVLFILLQMHQPLHANTAIRKN